MITIELPGQPIAKGRPRVTTRGGYARTYTPIKTRSYEARLQAAALDVMGDAPPLDGPLVVHAWAYFEPSKSWPEWKRQAAIGGSIEHTLRPDLDNLVKTIDALNGIVWADDAQIVRLMAIKSYSLEPRFVVTVTEADGMAAQVARRSA